MIYRTPTGNMWDPSVLYHDGRYYLFSMYETEDETETARALPNPANNVWCAVSDDGVVWEDAGAVIKDQPSIVLKMFVRRLGGRFVMNYGSNSNEPGHSNDTIRFWESDDLQDWKPIGEDSPSHPDPRWYSPAGRWDHMYMLPDEISGGYVGYCVATTHERYPYPSCGLMQSNDGRNWQVLPPAVIEWGDTPLPQFEVGGCEREQGKYYLIGGSVGAGDNPGYGVYTLVSDHWNGPFRPDIEAYRLCGTTGFQGVLGVQWLASFARGKDNELLITNYLTDGEDNYSNFWGKFGWVWLLPIKEGVIDSDGHLRMGYWRENERLKGSNLALGMATLVHPERAPGLLVHQSETVILDSGDDESSRESTLWAPRAHRDDFSIAVMTNTLDLEKGAVIEGTLKIESKTIETNSKFRPSKAGFYFEESESSGTFVLLGAGHPRWRRSDIGSIEWGTPLRTSLRDVTEYGAATVTGIADKHQHHFRIFFRRNMFEVYIDDLLMQSFVTGSAPTGRFGFIVQNSRCTFADIQVWEMNL